MRLPYAVFLVSVAGLPVLSALANELNAPAKTATQPARANEPRKCAGFVVRTFRGGPDADRVAARCESLRQAWHQQWLSGEPVVTWESPCEVVIHGQRPSYLAAVGRSGLSTFGSSLVRRDPDGRITRRIDLLTTDLGELPALPHELVHVILADHLAHSPPLWIDEGLALLSDTPRKQALHLRDCREALLSGTALPLRELFHLDQPTSSRQFAAVYGQSLTVTRFLQQRAAPEKLLEFVRQGRDEGYDHALQAVYGIRSWDAFEREWREFVRSDLDNS